MTILNYCQVDNEEATHFENYIAGEQRKVNFASASLGES